jgi:hypothetical protein
MPAFAVQAALFYGGDLDMAKRKIILAFKGKDRQTIRKCLSLLEQMQNMDVRRSDKATKEGVPPVLFKTSGNGNLAGQITALINRCNTALNQKVGLQAIGPAPVLG